MLSGFSHKLARQSDRREERGGRERKRERERERRERAVSSNQ
jgi:hypothetical protein